MTDDQNDGGKKKSCVFTHSFSLFSAYTQFLHVFCCHHVMVSLVTSTHTIQVIQTFTSIANFNLVLDIEIENTERMSEGKLHTDCWGRSLEG